MLIGEHPSVQSGTKSKKVCQFHAIRPEYRTKRTMMSAKRCQKRLGTPKPPLRTTKWVLDTRGYCKSKGCWSTSQEAARED